MIHTFFYNMANEGGGSIATMLSLATPLLEPTYTVSHGTLVLTYKVIS